MDQNKQLQQKNGQMQFKIDKREKDCMQYLEMIQGMERDLKIKADKIL